jgi:hypothetical protein
MSRIHRFARSARRSGFAAAVATLAALALAGSALGVAEAEPMDADEAEMAAEPTEPAKAAEPAMDDESAAPAAPAASGRVARSSFTTAIVDREPQDAVTSLANDRDELAYFTELHGLEGHTVVHRWEYGDEVMAEVGFEVGGPRWRVHSTKNLDPSWTGTWSVTVLADGEVLTREVFDYLPAEVADVATTPEASGGEAKGVEPAADPVPANAPSE